jgi:hypothetical protein
MALSPPELSEPPIEEVSKECVCERSITSSNGRDVSIAARSGYCDKVCYVEIDCVPCRLQKNISIISPS